MDKATREAFATFWDNCTPEQKSLREAWLPRREGDAQAEYDAMLVHRLSVGLPLSKDAGRRARRLSREIGM